MLQITLDRTDFQGHQTFDGFNGAVDALEGKLHSTAEILEKLRHSDEQLCSLKRMRLTKEQANDLQKTECTAKQTQLDELKIQFNSVKSAKDTKQQRLHEVEVKAIDKFESKSL